MGDRFERASRDGGRARGVVLAAWFALLVSGACRNSGGVEDPSAAEPEPGEELRLHSCGVDQVREFHCESLLPVNSAQPAPHPFETCPAALEVEAPLFTPLDAFGQFDAERTIATRRRAAPGQQCCYSWCSALEVKEPKDVPPHAGCDQPLSFVESFCSAEPEAGVSAARGAAPYDRCAAAVRPPAGAVFSVPPAASLDPRRTAARRQLGFVECCYAWCSIAPPGSGLERGSTR